MFWVIGMMATGKSTAGAIAAQQLGISFHDSDAMVVERSGLTIQDLWEGHGEAHFRELEREAIDAIPAGAGVAAAGGGTPIDPENSRIIGAGSSVVWLRCQVDVLLERVGDALERPLLGSDPRASLTSLVQQRTPIYEALATDEIDTTRATLQSVAEELVALWKP